MKERAPQIFLLILVISVSLLFFGLIKDFLMAAFWAIVLALMFHNPYKWIAVRLKAKTNLAAAITLILILLLVIVPVSLIGWAVVKESIAYYTQLQDGNFQVQHQLDTWRQQIPMVETWLRNINIDPDKVHESISQATTQLARSLAGQAVGITQNLMNFFLHFFLMLYMLFFFLRDGRKILRQVVRVFPLDAETEIILAQRFASVARATIKGSLIVAIVQGTIGGLLFWLVGIPGAVLWAVVMTILSLLPVGSGLIWGPAAIILYFQGRIGAAILVFLVGALIIGLIDNFLRPRLVGNDTKMPDYLILLSTLGGLAWVGLPGFVIGPIVAALFITSWDIFGRKYSPNR